MTKLTWRGRVASIAMLFSAVLAAGPVVLSTVGAAWPYPLAGDPPGPGATDGVGPVTSDVRLRPSSVGGRAATPVSLLAGISDIDTGGTRVTAAEYFLGAHDPGAGSGTAMTIPQPDVTVVAVASLDVSTLTGGRYAFSVRGQDVAGNWGAAATTTLLVDDSGPVVANVSVSPNVARSGSSPHLTADARDADVDHQPASAITAAEYYVDTDPGAGHGTAMTPTDGHFDSPAESLTSSVSLAALAPNAAHNICVRARDELGNWSPTPTCASFRIEDDSPTHPPETIPSVPSPIVPSLPDAPSPARAPTRDQPRAPTSNTNGANSANTASSSVGRDPSALGAAIARIFDSRERMRSAETAIPAAARRLRAAEAARSAVSAASAPALTHQDPLEPPSLGDVVATQVAADPAVEHRSAPDAVVDAIMADTDEARLGAQHDVDTATAELQRAAKQLADLEQQRASATTVNTQELQRLTDTTQYRINFAVRLLERLHYPVTVANVRAIVAWAEGEGMRPQNNNPLATTLGLPGAANVNSVGVKAFLTEEDGLTATARTLTNGLYENILVALREGASAQAVARAVADSPWGTGALVLRVLDRDG
jgi:hypothetical protein